jgi:hypothetical protein
MGKRRKDGNHPLQKNNSIEDLVQTEENGYSIPNPNKTLINITTEPTDAHKQSLEEEIMEEITEKFIEKILDTVNQKV